MYDFESRMVNTEHGSVHEADTVVAMKLYGDEQESFTTLEEFVRWSMAQYAPRVSHTRPILRWVFGVAAPPEQHSRTPFRSRLGRQQSHVDEIQKQQVH